MVQTGYMKAEPRLRLKHVRIVDTVSLGGYMKAEPRLRSFDRLRNRLFSRRRDVSRNVSKGSGFSWNEPYQVTALRFIAVVPLATMEREQKGEVASDKNLFLNFFIFSPKFPEKPKIHRFIEVFVCNFLRRKR